MSIEAARTSLLGLAVGDAFGTMLDGYGPELSRRAAKRLISMKRPWRWTDDTAMAIPIVDALATRGTIDPDALAAAFASAFARDANRGYGAGAHDLLTRINAGGVWRTEAAALFRGQGSYGNGAAMRAAPIGAFFAPDLERVRTEALLSAAPTHAHPDGAAGAACVAIAAALAQMHASPHALLAGVVEWTPPGRTRDQLRIAVELGLDAEVQIAGETLGTGANIAAHDTAPFAIWCAARHLASYEQALWTVCADPSLEIAPNAMSLSGFDRDTLGAITGGIVACAVGRDGIPLLWREATERLP